MWQHPHYGIVDGQLTKIGRLYQFMSVEQGKYKDNKTRPWQLRSCTRLHLNCSNSCLTLDITIYLIKEEVVRCCVHVCKRKRISLFKKSCLRTWTWNWCSNWVRFLWQPLFWLFLLNAHTQSVVQHSHSVTPTQLKLILKLIIGQKRCTFSGKNKCTTSYSRCLHTPDLKLLRPGSVLAPNSV